MTGYGQTLSYPEVLAQLGEENEAVFALDADLPSRTRAFAKRFPKRYLQVGIAEQNIMSIAAGLAARGKVPFVHIMAPFGTMRSFEQIRTDIAYARRNVKIVGACGGLSGGPWGPTHHTIEDIALMRVIPRMTVILPCNESETAAALRAAALRISLTAECGPTSTMVDTSATKIHGPSQMPDRIISTEATQTEASTNGTASSGPAAV